MEKVKEYINKLKLYLNSLKIKLSPKLLELDSKFEKLMPNPKLRKVAYIAMGSLFGFMLLIIILGILVSPLRNKNTTPSSLFKKPQIVAQSPKPVVELNENQKQIMNLKGEIEKLTFPDNLINIPIIERKLSI